METKELNGYIGYYKGKLYEVYADTSYGAQKKIAEEHGIKERGAISIMLAEKGGKPVIHDPADIEGAVAVSSEKIIPETIDKPEKSSIMKSGETKGEDEDEFETSSKTSVVSPSTRESGSPSSKLSQGVQAEGIQGVEESGYSPKGMPEESRVGSEVSEGVYPQRDVGEERLEHGYPAGDTGVRDRLTPGSIDTSLPKDIILNTASDIDTSGGAVSRFDANIEAIRVLKILDAEGRQAKPEEQAILAKYSGFGDSAFNDAFRSYIHDDNWKVRSDRLKELTTPEEYEAIERSRLNAFFTTPDVVGVMWDALRKMGADNVNNPHILEPSAGSGRFLGFQPTELSARSQRTAVELDQLTGRMLKQMYPETEVYIMGYQNAPIPKESVDIAISNVPFGDFPVNDPSFGKGRRNLTRQIHNYFFAKTLENLRPGGMLAFVTTHSTLDSIKAKPVREALAEQADLVSAIRLPKGTFPDTEVVADVIFMRKRLPDDVPGDQSWVDTDGVELKTEYGYPRTVHINKYFINNPDKVLGKQTLGGSMYRSNEYTVEPDGTPLSEGFSKALKSMPENIIKDMPRSEAPRSIPLPTGGNVYEGSRVVNEDGDIYIRRTGGLEKANLTAKEKDKVKAILAIRDSARTVLNLQLKDASDDEVTASQDKLNTVYDDFVTANGPLNNIDNTEIMGDDPDAPFLRALEVWTPLEAKTLKKATSVSPENVDSLKMPLFNQRTIKGMKEQTVTSNSDAVIVSLNKTGRLDFEYMGELLGKDAEAIRKELADERLIFKNPIGDWEIADKYLSGDVREKLRTVQAAATAKAGYGANLEALEAVQPADLPPSQISVKLGSPWVPSSDVNEFVAQLLDAQMYRGGGNYFEYVPQTGEWVTGNDKLSYNASSGKLTSEWGTERMPANEIIKRILNGKVVQVNDKGEDDKPVRNPIETMAAQEKANAIQAAFGEWIWSDPERASRLSRYYNDTFNTYRPRRFDGSHQVLPGMEESWERKIHPHQKDAIWRVVQDKTALLAHEVGFGKTAVMVGAGMELRRLGLSSKNVYVVPKATHGQFLQQFRELYPYANILFPNDDDFTPQRRPEFISRAVTGDWDAIILADTQFRRIPVKPETEVAFLRKEVADFRAALEVEERQGEGGYGRGSKKTPSHKEIQKALIRLEERLAEKQAKVGSVASERAMYFEDMGIDELFVDEADMYKNLRFATNMGRLKGLPNTDSDRAWDMYQKTRYLQDQGQGQGVVFATGTPVANTIAEMFTMMRYLQNPMLEAKGLQHFDAWAKTFGETTETLEQTPTGAYKMTQRFSKFQNAPELSNIWQQTADIRVAEESPHVVKLRPKLVDEEGKTRRTVISTPPDEALLDYMASLAKRADELSGKDPREDNMLKIASDARMASLDMRMVDATAKSNPNGKIAVASKKIEEIYEETEPDKGTQLVFLDLGTPKSKEKVSDENVTDPAEEYEETAEETQVLRNVYRVLRDHLVAAGIPAKDIAFIHDAKNNTQRKALMSKVNNGDIRVIVGSTGKMGVGVNIQERAAALHHLDAPWRPRDIEQREGRIIRQGNMIYGPELDLEGNVLDEGKGVRIYTYVTERSFDAYMWQAIEAKSKAIKAIMRRDNPPRNIEDIDSFTMSAGEAKAVASGNPDVLKAVTLKNDVTRLQMLKASNVDAKVRAAEQLRSIPKQMEQLQSNVSAMEKDAKLVKEDDKFAITIKDKAYSERTPAGEALKKAIEETKETEEPGSTPTIGKYKGFNVRVVNQGAGTGYKIILQNPETGFDYGTASILGSEMTSAGALQRLENKVTGIPLALEKARLDLQRSENNLQTYKAQAEIPFEYETRLEKMEAELARLEQKLQGKEVGEAIEYEELNGEPLNGEKALYKFTPREPEPEMATERKPKAKEKTFNKLEDEVIEEIETAPVTPEPAPPEVEKIETEQEAIDKALSQPEPVQAFEEMKKETEPKPTVVEWAKKEGYIPEGVEMPPVEGEKAPSKEDFVRSEVYKASIAAGKIGTDLNVDYVTREAERKYDALYPQFVTQAEETSKKEKPSYHEARNIIATDPNLSFEEKKDALASLANEYAEELVTPFQYGRIAYEQGIIKAPAQDKAFLEEYVKGKEVGDDTTLMAMQEWQRGYQQTAQEAEKKIEKETPAAQTKPPYPGMKLLTKALEAKLPKLYATEDVPTPEKVVIAKYFHPMSNITWYATEYDPEKRLFFGLVDGQEKEWGYFSLDELEGVEVRGLGIERDLYFNPTKVKDIPGLIETPSELEAAPSPTYEQLEKARKYIVRIKNPVKKDYALSLYAYHKGKGTEPKRPEKLSSMAAQSVEMEMGKLLEAKTGIPKETEAKFAEEAASTETISEREARRKVAPVTEAIVSEPKPRKPRLPKGILLKGKRVVADPEHPKEAKAVIAKIRSAATKAEKRSLKVTPAKARELRGNARAARRDADRIEATLPGRKPIPKGERHTMAELREIHAGRSPRSIATDNRQLHSNVIDIGSPGVEPWITDSGRADISGIDTPPITRRNPRLSGSKYPRITPKRPRLRK